MSDDRPEMTPRPWPDAVEPTTDELLPWFLEQSTEAQSWLLERLRDDASRGRKCWLMKHEDVLAVWRSRALAAESQPREFHVDWPTSGGDTL